ncbi:MAG: 30S ribosomal protein S27ae [Desulfurococcales archaeon]|jgi:small subunit ribosomal protein S27Ae|uniref:Small ribosomal subunit protein eS31 n=1 Tax=Fervidicoccus fontis TaxID=683846 RepID=A0A7J3SKP4_9CREN
MAETHKLYDFDYKKGAIRLKNKKCPRCGGVMGFHKQPTPRWYCGSCGYTEFLSEGK